MFVYKFEFEVVSDVWKLMLLDDIKYTKITIDNDNDCVELTTNMTIDEVRDAIESRHYCYDNSDDEQRKYYMSKSLVRVDAKKPKKIK